MADGLVIEMNTASVIQALMRLGDVAEPYVNAAAKETAFAIVREAKARLRRQLGPNATGELEAHIVAFPADNGSGWVVAVDLPPAQSISLHRSSKTGRTHTQKVTVNMLPLWVEKGTKRGDPHSHTQAARPYFYVSAMLEEGTHFRRIVEALTRAAADVGLGD